LLPTPGRSQGDGRFDAPPDWAERSQGKDPGLSAPPPLALTAQDSVPRQTATHSGGPAPGGMPNLVLCVGRVPLVAVWLKPSCRWRAPSSGWPLETVGAWREEGEREARWEEREREARWEVGREREAAFWALLLSPPWALLLSPPWALLPSPAWYSRPDYRSVCWSRRWGDSRPEADGDGGAPRRRRRAAFSRSSRFDLPQLLLLSSTCELARAAGVGVLSGGVCERARRAISFTRVRSLALFHVI